MRRWARWGACQLVLIAGWSGACSSRGTNGRAMAPPAASAPPAAAPPVAERAKELLAAEAELAKSHGGGALGLVAMGLATDGEKVGGFIQQAASSCAFLYARGSKDVEDLDILAYGENGDALGADEAPDPNPGMVLCTREARRIYVSARVAAGRGLVAVGQVHSAYARGKELATALHVPGGGKAAPLPETWPGLRAAKQRFRGPLGGRWADVRRTLLPIHPDAPAGVSFSLPKGKCASAVVLGGQGVRRVSLALRDESGRAIGRGGGAGQGAHVALCSERNAQLSLEVRSVVSAGLAAVVISVATESELSVRDPLPLELHPRKPLAAQRKRWRASAERKGLKGAPKAKTGKTRLGVVHRVRFGPGANCRRWDVILGSPAAGVSSEVWTKGGELVASAQAGSHLRTAACGLSKGGYLELSATYRGGPMAVEERKLSLTKQLAAAPKAAVGAALNEALRRGHSPKPTQWLALASPNLAPRHEHRHTLEVAAGKCQLVVLGLSPGSEGAQLAAFAERSPWPHAQSRGTQSAALRLCAGKDPKRFEIVSRVASGTSASALLSVPSPLP